MADYDTSIRVKVKTDNSALEDTERGIDEVKERLEEAKKKADALEDAGAINTEAYKEAKSDVEKWTAALDKNIQKQKEAAKAVTETPDSDVSGSVPQTKGDFSSISDEVEDYATRLKYLRDQGLGFGDEEYDQLYIAWKNASDAEKEYAANLNRSTKGVQAEEERIQSIRKNAEVSNQNLVDLLEEQTQLEAKKAELKKAGVTDGYKEYDDINARLAKIKEEVEYQKTGFKKMGDSAKKAFKKVNDGAKKSGGLLDTFKNRLKGIALSLLVFNWITKAFNAMVNGMKEGFNNLVQYSDEYNDSMSQLKSATTQLKNSFATAVAPIVSMVIPGLVQLISYITAAANKVAEFAAIMTGASTWTKAVAVQEDYAASLSGTASSAKKAAGALASFDSLNVLSKSDSGDASTTSPKDMFEEVSVDQSKVSAFDAMKESAKELKEIFASGFWDGLGDCTGQIETIKSSLGTLKEALLGIFAGEEISGAASQMFTDITYALGQTVGAFVSMGFTLAENLLGGTALYLDENGSFIKEKLTGMFEIADNIAVLAGEAITAFAYVFSAFGDENGQALTAALIGIFANAFLGLAELKLMLKEDIINIFVQPFIDNQEALRTAVDGFLGTVTTVLETFKDAVDDTLAELEEVYAQYIGPFFDSVAEGLSYLTESFLTFWNEYVQPLLDEWAEDFDVLWKEHIQPFVNELIVAFGMVAEALTILWEKYIVPFIDWIIQNILPVLLPICDGIVDGFFAVVEGVADAVGGIIKSIQGILDFLIGVFTGDWDRAWEGIIKIFEGVSDMLKGIVNGILGIVEALANGVIGAVNMIIKALNNINFDVPDWVPGVGGKSIGFHMSQIPEVSLPRLANGAVIRGGNPFAAILGDQPFGQTNVETPVSTIEDAVTKGMERYSGSRSLTVNLNYDGETFARLALGDILAEMERAGYDIDILGGTV